MWYVIQTTTGREEELVSMIGRLIPHQLYQDCFVMYHERVWRRQGAGIVHTERMFPGYVFIISDEPGELFLRLKEVPMMTKLIADASHEFVPIVKQEEEYLRSLLVAPVSGSAPANSILPAEKIVRLSFVKKDADGNIRKIEGPLKQHREQVVRYNWKKRYVVIEVVLFGEKREVVLGIRLKEDPGVDGEREV